MTRRLAVILVFAALWSVLPLTGQRSASTTLAVWVVPEARVNPAQLALRFRVSPDGTADVTSHASAVTAWVRALPNQRIGVLATARSLSGAAGPVPLAALQWTGSQAQATGGGVDAACAAGSFGGGPSQELVSGWRRSGTLSCTLVFSLDPRNLPPGEYAGVVELKAHAE